ncbi:MAG: ferrochelatase [Alphaproteobacteria bacterium]|nr:ferrochelatase [Alphaproteobacteria bacterium]NDC56006.1 ferrochelatase [Alphaproteobacteria bacterium]NDG03879.1 ferrochelatase [Alphaproteobacteria bacterium]
MITSPKKLAIVLFNLGGPLGPPDVQPFLFNLFNDPAIIRAPFFVRWPLAQLISRTRAPKAQKAYDVMGGGSPLLANTQAQAEALEKELADVGVVKCFIAMRYWHPLTHETVTEVRDFSPDQIMLLPLYPQFSTTTTGSSLKLWQREAKKQHVNVPTQTLCCYPTAAGFIDAQVTAIRAAYDAAQQHGAPRILFSAHGLPEMVVKDGDPYQYQCEATTRALVDKLNIAGLDYVNCYQSRVGPLTWIGPDTEAEVHRAAAEKKPIIMVPIAFVSEHVETLVELDHEYGALARTHGCPHYARVPTASVAGQFISGLAQTVRDRLQQPCPLGPEASWGGCGPWRRCPRAEACQPLAA